VVFDKYHNGRTAIRLVQNGSPYATATINDDDVDLRDDEVIIKNYSENKGILEALERAGIVSRLYTIKIGFTEPVVCKLLKTNE